MGNRYFFCAFFEAILCFSFVSARGEGARPRRVLTPDDVIKQEVIYGASVSPDHAMIAFVRWRPTTGVSGIGRHSGEIWVASVAGSKSGHEAHPISGQEAAVSYWNPRWSPDGLKLAMLVTDTTRGWHLAVWDVRTNRLIRLGNTDAPVTVPGIHSFAWVDNEHLAAIVGTKENALAALPGATIAESIWQGSRDASQGTRTSSHVMESGLAFDPQMFPEESVVSFGTDGSVQTITRGVNLTDMTVSPDGRYIAVLKQTGRRRFDNTTKYDYEYGDVAKMTVDVVSTAGEKLSLKTAEWPAAKRGTFSWATDSRSYAFLGTYDDTIPPHIFRGTVENGTLQEVRCDAGVTPRSLLWAGNELLFAADRSAADSGHHARRDWWRAPIAGASESFTEELQAVPSELRVFSKGHRLVGIGDGMVWRFDLDAGKWTNLAGSLGSRTQLLAIDEHELWGDAAVVSVRTGVSSQFHRLDVVTGALTRIDLPSPLAQPVAYDSLGDILVWQASEPTGTHVTMSRSGAQELLLEVNQAWADIFPGTAKSFTYAGQDGQPLTGWLLLPPGYKEGDLYPLLTWVYAGDVMSSDRLPEALKFNDNRLATFIPLQLFAAHGYAVLVPSMPLTSRGQTTDVYLELTKGVMPAVDEVIRMGIADPQRLAVAGLSFGGFSVYGLISQTSRFRAAIGIAGPSDLVSLFGTLSNGDWYFEPSPSQNVGFRGMNVLEAGQGHMANPPWLDCGRYLRNSPIMYADRINTPLLILHGDMDEAVPSQQSDEMFAALFRQSKRAKYVRYSGERHAFFSPPNIRDMWHQMYDWLDQYTAPLSANK